MNTTKLLITLVAASLLKAVIPSTALLAQEPSPALNPVAEGIRAVAVYIADNGEQRAGVGGTFEALADGEFDAVLIQQISLPPLKTAFSKWTLEHRLGGVHTTCFSGEKNHEGIGLGVSWKLVKLPLVDGVSLPTIRELSELKLGLSVSVDVDEAIDGRFARDTTVAAVTFGWEF